jgi:leucyl aminopeptidase
MFDFATLTGACMVALGPYTAGVMSDHDFLVKDWLAAPRRPARTCGACR